MNSESVKDNLSLGTFERVHVDVHNSSSVAAVKVAEKIAALIQARAGEGRYAVLGLATGSTPVPVYRELIRKHKEEGLSFSNVITFNLDEYYPLERSHRESYWKFMQEQLFAHIDIQQANIHLPSGEVSRDEAFNQCREYEQAINEAGGIDLQLLGIGRTGHIGFNEPGSGSESRTRLVTLDAMTRRDAARDFLGEGNVPRYAITMGVGTILEAREILLLAWGRSKAGVVKAAVEGTQSDQLPASFLQKHFNTRFVVDQAAASELTRNTEPWRVGFVEWTPELVRRAVAGLSLKVGKPVLKLVEKDYNENGLADLLTVKGSAYQLNIEIFNVLQHAITGWPGGKPGADDSQRPERAEPKSKRVLFLASEPQEDILGAGGTIHRLKDQGHEVTIAYLTSGGLAVPDEEAISALDLTSALNRLSGAPAAKGLQVRIGELKAKGLLDEDSLEIREVKSAIREAEARQAVQLLGIESSQLKFLNLPFYSKGRYRRFSVEQEDVRILVELLDEVKPHQIFLTGDQADPSSVAGIHFQLFNRVFKKFLTEADWSAQTYVWMYRGSGEEWPIHEVNMAVPLSPDELRNKITAAFQHRSQHSQNPYALLEQNESWQRTEYLNRNTAKIYDALGMAEYEAIECFVRHHP